MSTGHCTLCIATLVFQALVSRSYTAVDLNQRFASFLCPRRAPRLAWLESKTQRARRSQRGAPRRADCTQASISSQPPRACRRRAGGSRTAAAASGSCRQALLPPLAAAMPLPDRPPCTIDVGTGFLKFGLAGEVVRGLACGCLLAGPSCWPSALLTSPPLLYCRRRGGATIRGAHRAGPAPGSSLLLSAGRSRLCHWQRGAGGRRRGAGADIPNAGRHHPGL